jgi:3'(2'), 5'-bisphosphate nucleotidase
MAMVDVNESILEVARGAARSASALCLAVLADAPSAPEAMAKRQQEPVTVADYGSQAVILEAVSRVFPSHGVVAEEGSAHLEAEAGEAGSEQVVRLVGEVLGREVGVAEVRDWIDHVGGDGAYTWVVDPIDGTKGYLRRQQFAIAIGVLHEGEIAAGVLACPHLPWDLDEPDGRQGLLFSAARGGGAFAEALEGGERRPVRVSSNRDASRSRVLGSVESSHGDPAFVRRVIDEAGLGGGWVRLDSQVKYGAVAAGMGEVYLRPRSRPDYRENIWDHAAGVAVVSEAGGRVTDLDGRELDFSLGRRLEENRGVLATNGLLHDEVLEAIGAVEEEPA